MASKKKPLKKKATPPYKSKERSKGKSYSKVLPPKKKAASTKLKKSLKVVYSKKKAPPKKARAKSPIKKTAPKKVIKKAAKKVVKKAAKKVIKKAVKKTSKKAIKKTPSKPRTKRAGTYKLVTLDAKTEKIIQPKPRQPVLFAIKSPEGKVTKLSTEYSQPYLKTDFQRIRKELLKGTPRAFAVYQEKTKTQAFHYEHGKKILEYMTIKDWENLDKKGKPTLKFKLDAQGKPIKKYRYKLTGQSLKREQRTAIMGDKGFIQPTGKGFTKKTKRESGSGHYKLLKVYAPDAFRKYLSDPIYLTGKTIKDTIKNLKPDLSTKALGKKKYSKIGYYGHISIERPVNPYKQGTGEHDAREAWIKSVWGDNKKPLRVSFQGTVNRMVNFSDQLAVTLRSVLSMAGYRVTSLYDLEQFEADAIVQDEESGEIGFESSPSNRIMAMPVLGDRRTSAGDLIALRPENEFNHAIRKPKHSSNAQISISIALEGIK